jgi:hypothetical protein
MRGAGRASVVARVIEDSAAHRVELRRAFESTDEFDEIVKRSRGRRSDRSCGEDYGA